MKLKNLLATFFTLSLTFNVFAGELRSKYLKELLCTELESELSSRVVSTEECLQGSFMITETESLEFNKKKYTISMDLEVMAQGSTYKMNLSRDFLTSTKKLTKWKASFLKMIKEGVEATIKKTDIDDANTLVIKKKRAPQSVQDFEGDTMYDGADDYSSEVTFYAILNADKEVIGYIAYQWFESESEDIKGYTIQRYDLKGNEVGSESSESFGYHE